MSRYWPGDKESIKVAMSMENMPSGTGRAVAGIKQGGCR